LRTGFSEVVPIFVAKPEYDTGLCSGIIATLPTFRQLGKVIPLLPDPYLFHKNRAASKSRTPSTNLVAKHLEGVAAPAGFFYPMNTMFFLIIIIILIIMERTFACEGFLKPVSESSYDVAVVLAIVHLNTWLSCGRPTGS
jgi:hypothetical protein